MQTKEIVISKVLIYMEQDLDNEELQKLKQSLVMTMYDYDIIEKEPDSKNGIVPVGETDCLSTHYLLSKLWTGKRSCNRSPRTLEQYKIAVIQLTEFTGKELGRITTEDVEFFLVGCKEKNGWSDVTAENKRRNLSSVFRYLSAHDLIQKNPMDMVEPVKCKRVIKNPLTDEEIERIKINCEKDKRNMAMIHFLMDTGVRVSELCNIKISDVDFKNYTCKVLGKGNKERIVAFSGKCATRLNDYLMSRKDVTPNGYMSGMLSDNTYLFVSKRAPYNRLKKDSVEEAIRRIKIKAFIKELTPHTFRRTFATNLRKRGVDISVIAEALGHENLNTVKRYVKVTPQEVCNEIKRAGSAA